MLKIQNLISHSAMQAIARKLKDRFTPNFPPNSFFLWLKLELITNPDINCKREALKLLTN
ncbi:hypothetical protein AYI94_17775 [Shewanella algae]|nr:hypothetical protein AYI94_17775 [Shewanella algae]